MTDQSFTRLAGWAAMITALTTVGVHYVTFPTDTFEQRLALATDTGYLLHRWMIILHCLCVIISMLGIAVVKFNEGRGWILLGCTGYVVFGVVEITRMFSVLEYLNKLRLEYAMTTDPAVQQMLRFSMDHFQLAGFTLFAVFAFFFTLGNLCYGKVLSNGIGLTKWIGIGFLYWAATGIAGMLNDVLQWQWIDAWNEFHAKGFQPVFRALIGWWLLKNNSHFEVIARTQPKS